MLIHNNSGLPTTDYRQLKPLQGNLKDLTKANHDKLLRVLNKRGFTTPVFVWQDGEDMYLMDGHQRSRVMIANDLNDNGSYEVPYVLIPAKDLKEAKEQLLEITSQYGHMTIEGLDEFAFDLELSELDVNFDAIDMDKFLDDHLDADEADDEAPEVDEVNPPVSVLGEVYQLGAHRLMCGDSTSLEAVERLMDGAKANVVVTSPPYASQRKYDESSGFKPIKPDEYSSWYRDIATNIMAILADDGSYFCNIKEHCADGQRHLYVTDLLIDHVRNWGWRWIDTFCWRDTGNGIPGGWNNRFKDAWEPVYHYSKQAKIKFNAVANGTESSNAFGYSEKNTTSHTGSGLLRSPADGRHDGIARPSNVLEFAPSAGSDHMAAYPVGLPSWFIKAFSDKGDTVYDPFMGSGTTMMAAEKLGRISYGMELSPRYADVIRKRYAKHIGAEDWQAVTPAVEYANA